ncbi:hypothetical protein [Rhodococcoides fascians]|uniref:hypothetical protein n=1 Tax=Rhodococcoides fascians TaxID=1828 RepID=UPI0018AF782E|nr:hypothetical protein [Rhodococcus fascians]
MTLLGGPRDGKTIISLDKQPIPVGCWYVEHSEKHEYSATHPDWLYCDFELARCALVAWYQWNGNFWLWVPGNDWRRS